MSIMDELHALEAPHSVLESGRIIQAHVDAGTKPPKGLVWDVQKWVGRQQEQNRYGK